MSIRVLIGACVATSLSACGGDSSNGVMSGSGALEAGSMAHDHDESKKCPAEYKNFSVGPSSMVAVNEEAGVALRVQDGPVPPEFGFNTWIVEILDPVTMAPLPDARLTWQCSFMSVHGHGSNPKTVENLGNGQYKIGSQNLRMLGPWEVKFWIDPTGTMPEYVSTSNISAGNACVPTQGLTTPVPTIEIKVCVPD